jgi:hypothetical protein
MAARPAMAAMMSGLGELREEAGLREGEGRAAQRRDR